MVVRTVLFLAVLGAVALMHLVVVRMVLLFFPAVAVDASILQITAVTVRLCLLFGAPEAALLLAGVLVLVGLAAVVLPVVRVLALVAHVALHLVVEGAPHRLEVEHVEVSVLLHAVQ